MVVYTYIPLNLSFYKLPTISMSIRPFHTASAYNTLNETNIVGKLSRDGHLTVLVMIGLTLTGHVAFLSAISQYRWLP